MQFNRENQPSTTAFSSFRDLNVVLEETESNAIYNNNNNYLSNLLNTGFAKEENTYSSSALPTLRRARAGTMPSMSMAPPLVSNSNMMIKPAVTNRHRSESLTLPVPPSGYSWRKMDSEPVSPSTEQFLQQGDDIALTLRSIGLDSASSSVPPVVSTRNRSQSVNNASLYQPSFFKSINFTTAAVREEEDNNKHRNTRPRSISMGRMDYNNSKSIWKNNDDTLYEETSVAPPPLSLGDSELLANILQKDSTESTKEVDLTALEVTSKPQQTNVSRSLWIGNISASLTTDILTQFFSAYGSIESVRLLLEKDCAFVNFYNVDDAVNAKEDILNNLGGRIANCIIRIGYGKTDSPVQTTTTTTVIETPVVTHPTRALWLGNMPPGTSQSTLQRLFSAFGTIESIRVLSFKNCAFINFEDLNSAIFAREALVKNEAVMKELWGVRVGFAKAPAMQQQQQQQQQQQRSNKSAEKEDHSQINQEIWTMMQQLGAESQDVELVTFLHSSLYFESIPPVPEYGYMKKHDAMRLKEIRKQLDVFIANNDSVESFDSVAMECMDEIAELSSDYIGNTIVQRLFEGCSEGVKTAMLKIIAPHLAALGVHKNGTWAAQKIIDSVTTPGQIQIISVHIQPFIPPLLLDQFGNYVVQCCLKLKGDTQYITNAIVDKLMTIAQGRFGARAVRGILDSKLITTSQQIMIATALIRNASVLSVNTNGSILLSWLIDSSTLNNRLTLISSQLAPGLVQIATTKLGSHILLKLINQDTEPAAREELLKVMDNTDVLSDILKDQTRGLSFVLKVMSSEYLTLDEKTILGELAYPILTDLQGLEYKKALVEFVPNVKA